MPYYVYIMTNTYRERFYIGVTSDLRRRVWQHENKYMSGFTKRYNLNLLIYFEDTGSIESAIQREKQLKGWTRKKKMCLIDLKNPTWESLNSEILSS